MTVWSDPAAKLKEIEDILFPPSTKNNDGSRTIHDADENLDAALHDLRRTDADSGCIKTVEDVTIRLYRVRELIGSPNWNEK